MCEQQFQVTLKILKIMLGYINSNRDKSWKACSEEQFNKIVDSAQVARIIAQVRNNPEGKHKQQLPAFIFQGRLDEARYAAHQALCKQQGTTPKASRCEEFLHPTGLFMMDFDRKEGNPTDLYEAFLKALEANGIQREGFLALAHITPSGYGLRLVLKRRPAHTVANDQQWVASLMDEPFDTACKDLSRLSYAVARADILFIDPKLLFGNEEYATESVQPAIGEHSECATASMPMPNTYEGMPYTEIVEALIDQLGGRPAAGGRNNFIFRMACHLRHICNDNPEWLMQIIPTFGETPEKVKSTVCSALNRPQAEGQTDVLKRALKQVKLLNGMQENPITATKAPAMPKKLPPLIALLTKNVPKPMKAAVAHAVFPALGAHLNNVRFRYIDNTPREPSFMCVQMAKMSTGKSAVNKPIEYILADIVENDNINRQREQEWKNAINTKGSNKEKPKRPEDLCIQVLSADMTNAAFVQRLQDAAGKFLYTQMDEVELLDQLKTSKRGNQVTQIIRMAFDCGSYGQERVGSQSVTARVQIRWNWNASTTIQRGKRYFRSALTDGTLSRLNFCTIEPQENGKIPVYGNYDHRFAEALKPFIDRLNEAQGEVECAQATRLATKLLNANAETSLLSGNEAYEVLSYRANLIAFHKAMTLFIAEGGWTKEIENFVRWSEEYDLWCKMHFFGEALTRELETENVAVHYGPRNMLEQLPQHFSRQELIILRRSQGQSDDPRYLLSKWKSRGLITDDVEPNTYRKCAA